jgi:Carboxypeptidase regulatory-like domain/TonB dependent receptor
MEPLTMLGRKGILLFSLTAFSCLVASAQVSNGTIVGTITDTSGAVVSGARVTVRNIETGLERNVTADASGDYDVPDLVAGHYSITVTHSGFSTATVSDFELLVAQRASINTVLQVGATSEKVMVTSSTVQLLQTESSSVGQVIDTKAVASMPLNGRSFWQLTQLTPGVQYSVGGGGNGVPTGGGQIRASNVNVTVNGHASTFTGWYLDGSNITEAQVGGTIIQPNVDAIQEFRVEGGNMSAQYGHTPTVVNTTLKSGTNQFHGVAYEFLRNSAFDAKNYFYVPPPGTHLRDEPLHRNQFGGVFGGPIRRDKTYFFVDLENTRLSQSEDYNNVVPSLLERQGNFSQSSTIIKNPVTGEPYPSNTIPASAISSQAAYLLPFMPEPNYVSGGTYREINSNPLTQNLVRGDIRIDEQLTAADHIMGRYSIANNTETDPNPYPAMGTFPLESRGQNVVVNWTHILSPKWLNSLQASYYRSLFTFSSSFTGQDINTPAGITGFNDLAPLAKMGFPTISISNYSEFTGASAADDPKQNRIRSPQYLDIASYSVGKHDISFGAEIIHNTIMFDNGAISSGIFTFSEQYSGDNFADFLLGYPYEGQRSYYSALYGNVGTFQGYFFQDNYRILPTLTLNLGFRWEVNPFYYGDKGQLVGYDPVTNNEVIPSDFSLNAQPITPTLYPLFQDRIELTNSLNLPRSISPTEKHDAMPRIGIAYSPAPNWVLRANYGLFFVFPDDNLINNTITSVPFVASQTVFNTVGSTGPTSTLGNFFGSQPIATGNPNPGTPCSFGLVLDSCSTPTLTPMALGLKQQYVNAWSAAVQHEFGSRVSLDVAYVANNTVHGEERDSTNDPSPGPGSIQTRRPVPQWGTIGLGIFNGKANYNALQTKLETQAWHGATLLASYTYSKCLDNGTYNQGTIYVLSTINYYGPCSFNLKHNFVTSYVYQLPFGKGQPFLGDMPSWANGIVGGWQLTGITTMQSGLPFTPTISTDVANTGISGEVPNLVGKPTVVKSPSCWFFITANSTCRALRPQAVPAFAVPAMYTYGNGGRNILTQDDLIEWDFSLTKVFHLGEERSLEIRGEAFNVFNRTTFGAPSANIDQSSGATVGNTFVAPREIELAAKLFF